VQITGAFAASADATITGGDITGANGNAIDIGEAADGSITLSRDDAGTVTLTCVDNDANADLTIVAGGTGDIVVGDVTDTSVRVPIITTVTDSTVSRVCTSADYGKIVLVSSNAAVAITLPANGAPAGAWIDFMVTGTDDCAPTIASATADTLITPNSADSDSVTYGSGHRIGAYVRCISDGTAWHAMNMGGTTMSVTDTD
jgi:hypothetical protein